MLDNTNSCELGRQSIECSTAYLERLASPGYADQMMLLDWDATYDVDKLRAAGFDYFPTPIEVLEEVVADMRRAQLIPQSG